MAGDQQHPQRTVLGLEVNAPAIVARVKDFLPIPTTCHFCDGEVHLVNNAQFYGGRQYGWPLAYACSGCGARVGCHPHTDIPLGTLADRRTMLARRAAHDAFDPLWQEQGPGSRTRAYKALTALLGKPGHISWLDAEECVRVIELVAGGKILEQMQRLGQRRTFSPTLASVWPKQLLL